MSFAVLSFVVNSSIGLIGAVVISRLYGVDVIGEYALVIAPWVLLIQLSSIAERIALVRELAGLPARSPRVAALFLPVLGFSALLTFVVSIPVLVVTALIYRGPAHQPQLVLPATLVVLGYLVFDNTSSNLDGVFSAFRAGRELFIGRFVQIATFPLLAIVFVAWERTVVPLTVATLVAMVLSLSVRLVMVRAYLSLRTPLASLKEGVRDLPSLLKFGLKIVPAQLIGGFGDQAGTWVLGAVAPISVVGAWSRAFTLSSRMNEAGYRIDEISYPTLVRRFWADDMDGFARALSRIVRFAAILVFFPAAVAGGAATGILRIFGPGFDQAAAAFAILLFALGLGVLGMLFGQALVAAGRPHLLTVGAILRATLALGLLVPGAIYLEATGAALALATAIVVEVVVQVVFLEKYVTRGCIPPLRPTLVILAASVVGFAASRIADLALPSILGIAVAVVAGTICYGGILLLGAFEPSERTEVVERLRALRNRGRSPVSQ